MAHVTSSSPSESQRSTALRTGWNALLTRISIPAILGLALTGLVITFAPFHAVVEWTVLLHTLVGLVLLVPVMIYLWRHFLDRASRLLDSFNADRVLAFWEGLQLVHLKRGEFACVLILQIWKRPRVLRKQEQNDAKER